MQAAQVVLDGHELLRIGVGKWPQQDRIYQAEDGRIGTDSERQSQSGDQRKTGIPAQHPEGEEQVLLESHGRSSMQFKCRVGSTLMASSVWERLPGTCRAWD